MSKMEFVESDTPLAEWLKENGKKVIWGLAALFVFLFLIFRLYSSAEVKSEKDFIDASQLQTKIFIPAKAEASLKELNILVSRHPELKAEYDGLMAQAYLNQGKVAEAAPLIQANLKRVASDSIAPFISSSQLALEISEGKLDTAYPKALALKEELKDSRGPLYYFNLVRLGMLQEAMGKTGEEKATWQEFLEAEKAGSPGVIAVSTAIEADGASFTTFIQERLNKLK